MLIYFLGLIKSIMLNFNLLHSKNYYVYLINLQECADCNTKHNKRHIAIYR